jgi:hypothetical protein
MFQLLPAPGFSETIILRPEPIYIYNISDPFARAVFNFESRFREKIVNKISGASGIGQITPVMIKEVNRILRKKEILISMFLGCPVKIEKYKLSDAFDPYKTYEIWLIVQEFHNPEYYYDKACRIWFGTGKQHDSMVWEDYYNEVMKYYKD